MRNPRETRRQLRARRVVEIVPVERLPISPPPRESMVPVWLFAITGIVVGLWAIAFITARAREVMVAGGW